MDTLTQSNVFFIISSVGFVLLWILTVIFLIYLIRITSTFSRIMNKVEEDIENISDATKDVFLDMRESAVFQFLFGSKRKSRKK